MKLHPETLPLAADRIGEWTVLWSPGEFIISDVGSFSFERIVLPIEIIRDASQDSGVVVVKLEDGFKFEILQGSTLSELAAFKQRASAEVLAAIGRPAFCFDCAREAGRIPRLWSGRDCVGCRGPYCRNPFCLRRLDAGDEREGHSECRSCRSHAGFGWHTGDAR